MNIALALAIAFSNSKLGKTAGLTERCGWLVDESRPQGSPSLQNVGLILCKHHGKMSSQVLFSKVLGPKWIKTLTNLPIMFSEIRIVLSLMEIIGDPKKKSR